MSEPTIRNALPAWSEPGDLKQAATIITKLGRNMHEHAYLVGRTLLWVKKEVGHGKFLKWLEGNVWFGQPTAYHMMRFANACISKDSCRSITGTERNYYLVIIYPPPCANLPSAPSPTNPSVMSPAWFLHPIQPKMTPYHLRRPSQLGLSVLIL